MIKVDAALKDLEALEAKAPDVGTKVIVGVAKVLVKILSTMRTNQLLTEDDKKAIKKDIEARRAEKR